MKERETRGLTCAGAARSSMEPARALPIIERRFQPYGFTPFFKREGDVTWIEAIPLANVVARRASCLEPRAVPAHRALDAHRRRALDRVAPVPHIRPVAEPDTAPRRRAVCHHAARHPGNARVRPLLHGALLRRVGELTVLHPRSTAAALRDAGRGHRDAIAGPRPQLAVRHRGRGAVGWPGRGRARAAARVVMVSRRPDPTGRHVIRGLAADASPDLPRVRPHSRGDGRLHPSSRAGGMGRAVRHGSESLSGGQLDGGRIAYALFGAWHRQVSIATFFGLLALGVVFSR